MKHSQELREIFGMSDFSESDIESDSTSFDSESSSFVPPEGLLQFEGFSDLSDEEFEPDSVSESEDQYSPQLQRRARRSIDEDLSVYLSPGQMYRIPTMELEYAGTILETAHNSSADHVESTTENEADIFDAPLPNPPSPVLASDVPSNSRTTPQSSKRKRSSQSNPSPKKAKEGSDDEESDCCPICFEPWSNSGRHRLASLKCGHLFGQKCIERWMKDAAKCPQCNTKARKSDIRVLYAKRLKAVDTTELTKALNDCEKEREKRRNKEMELAQVRMQYQMMMEECKRLKSQVEDLKNQHATSALPQNVQNSINNAIRESTSLGKQFCHVKNLIVSQSGNCRVMDFHADSMSLAISQPSPHASFMPGFGVKKFSMGDMKSSQFVILHSKPIRDIRYSPHSPLLLTASQDQTLKIMSLNSNSVVHTYKPQRPVWCCCWDQSDSNILYAGLSNGTMACYDTRSTSEAVFTIANPRSRCPIVSMYNIPRQNNSQTPGGLLVQTLEGVTFWQNGVDSTAEYKPNYLPLEPGSCVGMRFSSKLNQCLVSYRPGRSYNRTTHLLCQLKFNQSSPEIWGNPRLVVEGGVTCKVIKLFQGSLSNSLLTRNALFSTSNGLDFVCIGDESKKMVNVYNTNCDGSKLIQSLSCSAPALDILPAHINERQFLSTLTEKELKIYELK